MITETLQDKKTIVRDFYDTAFNQKKPEEAVAMSTSDALSRKKIWWLFTAT